MQKTEEKEMKMFVSLFQRWCPRFGFLGGDRHAGLHVDHGQAHTQGFARILRISSSYGLHYQAGQFLAKAKDQSRQSKIQIRGTRRNSAVGTGNARKMSRFIQIISIQIPFQTSLISLDALFKVIDPSQLTLDLEGSLHYDHAIWIELRCVSFL